MAVIEFDTVIIGAGPAGLFTAIHRDQGSVLLLEKMALPGRKLMVAGSGRCNFTHTGNISEFFSHYGEQFRFLRTALHRFTNLDLVNFFTERGLPAIIDKNGKIFPESEKSADVLNILVEECRLMRVTIFCNQAVSSIVRQGENFIIKTTDTTYSCRHLVISTGGMSYPATGSSGDGYAFAKHLGHSIAPPKPALTPVFIRSYRMAELAGVSIQDKSLSIYRDNKKIHEHRGDIGFTHKGLSGPGILDFSRYMQANDILKINLLDINADDLRRILIEESATAGKTAILTFLKRFEIPRSLVKIILGELRIDPELTLATIIKEMRNQLVSSFCEYPFVIERVGGFNMAMVTHGGVVLKEVSSKTLESILVPNLYFAGEVLNIDGDTGGYNLQAAFSTGFLVADSINGKNNTEKNRKRIEISSPVHNVIKRIC